MHGTNNITKSVTLLFIMGMLAAGCASSKCDCPKVHHEVPVANEIQV